MIKWTNGEIVEKRQWTETLFSLKLEAPLQDFNAGQFIRVAMDIDDERVARAYSLLNAPWERPLEIYFNEISDGPLTPRLSELNPGDRIWVSEKASGVFIIDRVPECRDLWLLATGTALGVYLSILKTETPWRRFDKIVLVHGCRTAEELNYGDVVNECVLRYGNQFEFFPLLSRERKEEVLHGRVTTLLSNGTLEKRAGRMITAQSSHVMLCGNSAMIADMRALLESRGLNRHTSREPGHYTTEQYY